MSALIQPSAISVGAQLRQRYRSTSGQLSDRGRERKILVRYLSVMEICLGISGIPTTFSSYKYRDVFVGLPDSRRKYIDRNGQVRRTAATGGVFYRAYAGRCAGTECETFVEWCKEHDEKGRRLPELVIQRVQIPCVSRPWHVERLAWYYLLREYAHTTSLTVGEGTSYVEKAFEIEPCINEGEAQTVGEWVDDLETWWRVLYEKWLTELGQSQSTRSDVIREKSKEAFQTWRDGRDAAEEGGENNVNGKDVEPRRNLGRRRDGRLPQCREEFCALGFEFEDSGNISRLPPTVYKIMEEVLHGPKLCHEPSSFILCVLNALSRGEQVQYFLTGRAGTGKSYVLGILRKVLEALGGNVLLLAPTALLARELGGHTIQSASGMRWGLRSRIGQAMTVMQRQADVVLIEEAGLVSSDDLEGCETSIREAKKAEEVQSETEEIRTATSMSEEAWGGCHVVAAGDFGQMKPPGVRALPIWTSRVWEPFGRHTFALETVQRAEEMALVEVLGIVRDFAGCDDPRVPRLQELLSVCVSTESDNMHLCATHAAAQGRSAQRARLLKGKEVPYVTACAEDRLVGCQQTDISVLGFAEETTWEIREKLSRNHAAVVELDMFVGEQYILTTNSQYNPYVRNGTIVTVEGVEMDVFGNPTFVYLSSLSWEGLKRMARSVVADQGGRGRRPTVRVREVVTFRNGTRRTSYRKYREGEEGRVVQAAVARKQFAMLMFAGGGTVHGFQGATLKNIGIDCTDDLSRYCEGMMYVALSRVRRLEHLQISRVADVIVRIKSCHMAVAAYRRCIGSSAVFHAQALSMRAALNT